MQFKKGSIQKIELPKALLEELLQHCRRKLKGECLSGENNDLKAFGLTAGKQNGSSLTITAVTPLKRNARDHQESKGFMDEVMAEHAIPSETPLEKRGWVADPNELHAILKEFRKKDFQLVGSYHMHRVAWEHDRERDTPTRLDTILGERSRMFMFIIAMVDLDNPVVRAFFEGDINMEVPISIT